MKQLPIAWLQEDEIENIRRYDLGFNRAKEVLLNTVTIKLPNISGDSIYIGLTEDLSDVLYVYCKSDDGFRRIVVARRANKKEKDAFFASIARFL
jgi:uncharacterized DUF497 family protein